MNRAEQLKYCKVCKHRKADFKRGLICSLTEAKPYFQDDCSLFQVDKSEMDRRNSNELSAVGIDNKGHSTKWKRNKQNGVLLAVLGLLVVLGSYIFSFDFLIKTIAQGFIFAGLLLFIKGKEQERIMKEQDKFQQKIKEER